MANRLASETSPYLLQHASNPVDWYPWGEEALARAASEGTPILLSIGYAACHWCHVMERESFEDAEIARAMNSGFVCVKVDREERPDLDAIYMDAVQAMTGRGGWPMTVFLTPDGRPFYGGTYYPPEDRHGLPGFPRVLAAVREAWETRHAEVLQQADALSGFISRELEPHRPHELTETTLRAAVTSMQEASDAAWGGFGGAPKFPQPMAIEFLLRMHVRGQPDAVAPADLALRRMARGGLFDQLGGGFHRYSTDERWLVPHFEKMLYDNGQLLRVYANAFLVTGEPLYRHVAISTADYLLREMRHPGGGFFSSQDADSEGVEGKFYAWTHDAFVRAAGEDADAARAYFDVTRTGNWEGVNVLWVPRDDDVVAATLGIKSPALRDAVDRASARLFAERERRVRPATDDKILAAWNGLAISGLAAAGRAFDVPAYVEAAVDAARFVLQALRDPRGRLMRSWRDGHGSVPAFLDDHALMASACLDLYETTFAESWFAEAERLVGVANELFPDEAGGYFDSGSDAERLLRRPKELFDNVTPSGSSAMAGVLLRMAALTGDAAHAGRAEPILELLQPAMAGSPLGFGHLLGALDLRLGPAKEVAIAGDPSAGDTRALAAVAWRRFQPNRVLAVGEPASTSVPLLRDRTRSDGRATAFVCERFVCGRPVTEPAELAEQLAV